VRFEGLVLVDGGGDDELKSESLPSVDRATSEKCVGLDKGLVEEDGSEGRSVRRFTTEPVAESGADDEGDELLRFAT
jgi:hypothetical protein